MKSFLFVIAFVVAVGAVLIGTRSEAAVFGTGANGSGSLAAVDENGKSVKRQFSFSAQKKSDGSVVGHATLHNPAFDGAHGNQAYMLDLDITCLKIIGNVAFMGGSTRRTTDPNLVDAAYFSVEDNGEPGAGRDRISRVYFFDDDPGTNGDPGLCQGNVLGDFPMETIQSGNVQVRQ